MIIAKLAITTTITAGLLASPLCAAGVAASSPTTVPATTQVTSNTRFAYRQVRYPIGEYDPAGDEVTAIVDRSARALAASMLRTDAEIIAHTPGAISPGTWLETNVVVRADQADYLLALTIPPNAAPPIAKEFLDAVIAKSQDQIRELYDKARAKPLKDATRAAAEAQQRYTRAADELRELRDKLRDSAGRADVSPQSISDALSKLEEEKQKLELDVMGKQARRDALDQQIARQSSTIQKKVKDDAIAAELQKVVDARQAKVEEIKVMVKNGQASHAMLLDAVAVAADAQAKLLQRRHDAAAEAGGDALQAFNREAVTLSVDLSEANARLKFVQDRLTHLASASDQIDQLERARAQEQSAAKEVDKRTKALHELEEKIESLPPGELTVISSQNRATPPQNMFGGG